MEPPQPPLPTARNLPFHSAIGSHTSIRMSESEVGLRLAATRQKAGRWRNVLVLPVGVKVPVSTTFASVSVMDTVGETSFESLSHDWAWSAAGRRLVKRTILESIRPAFIPRTISRHL